MSADAAMSVEMAAASNSSELRRAENLHSRVEELQKAHADGLHSYVKDLLIAHADRLHTRAECLITFTKELITADGDDVQTIQGKRLMKHEYNLLKRARAAQSPRLQS